MANIYAVYPLPEHDLGRNYRFVADCYKICLETNTLEFLLNGEQVAVWKWSDVQFFTVEAITDED